jgi:hypothetical protein
MCIATIVQKLATMVPFIHRVYILRSPVDAETIDSIGAYVLPTIKFNL